MPIKRSEHIMALSRDHHAGLLFGWKIKEGLKRNVSFWRIDKYISYFWKAHLKSHFQEEEQLLFCLMDNELTRKAQKEHNELADWFLLANNGGLRTADEYLLFAELLISHIRFEERELFPYLETELPSEMLECVGESLAKLHETPFTDTYEDEFWADEHKQRAV
ncbi:MAG: hemerythrin protein [Mucilaginibacter sp.]|nr:hemerythrin protein [Mucilaginibacter sp.]